MDLFTICLSQVMIDAVKVAVSKGYTVMWDADVSNSGFRQIKVWL
jgi:hypothetical protein